MTSLDSLTTKTNNLSLASSTTTTAPSFSLFSSLPYEIRHNIYEHALTPPTLYDLHAHVLITSPKFGLFVTFTPSLVPSILSPTHYPSLPSQIPIQPGIPPLLVLNHESRSFHLTHHLITLPVHPGHGRLYISPADTIYITNMESLLSTHDFTDSPFYRSIRSNRPLQPFFHQITNFAFSLQCFSTPGPTLRWHADEMLGEKLVRMLVRFGGAAKVSLVIQQGHWIGLHDGGQGRFEVILGGTCQESIEGMERAFVWEKRRPDGNFKAHGIEVMYHATLENE